ncbi:hypothetical protein CA85_34790 [Allorhodopirellula solitaria]|uniref:Uncharacterized protein n=2 Tax=Allorhodopirellula solitaria TaxID=2527987 RepID=A0A5C5XU60_9BACT|nr:hypothetical protein CA85_34790 [Allorhodopirellula solitaria]
MIVTALSVASAGDAQTPLVLTAGATDTGSDGPARLPVVLTAGSDQTRGQIVLGEEHRVGSDAPSEDGDSEAKFNLLAVSMLDQKVVEKCELTLVPATGETADPAIQDNPAGTEYWAFEFSEPLPSGVYELVLEPAGSVSSRFRELLTWQRGDADESHLPSDQALGERTWPVIVLPRVPASQRTDAASATAAPLDASEQPAPFGRRLLARWAGFTDMNANSQSLTYSTLGMSSLTRILSRSDREVMSPSQRWFEILHRMDERLDQIVTAGADGIAIDSLSPATADEHEMLLMQCLYAKARQVELEVWQFNPIAESMKVPEDGSAVELVDLQQLASWPPDEDSPSMRKAANFLRSPLRTISSQFPADVRAAPDADLLCFGFEDSSDIAMELNATSSESMGGAVVDSPPSPVTNHDAAFQADAWRADWSSWCIRHSKSNDQHGLVVDETMLCRNTESRSCTAGDIGRLWKACWSADSRWLQDSRLSSDGKDNGMSERSLVQVRHAGIGEGTLLVCINQAPWPMRVRFPLADLVRWSSAAPSEVGTVPVVSPETSNRGSSLMIPASSMVVCFAEQRISPTMRYASETDDPTRRVAEVTRQVTTIVENLGILGELACISARSNAMSNQVAAATGERPQRTLIRQASAVRATNLSASSSEESPDDASFWSRERWGIGRAVASSDPQRSRLTQAVSTVEKDSSTSSEKRRVSTLRGVAQSECRNLVSNGGFELPHEIGVPGWMHAHHPRGAVDIDTLVCSEGSQSIRLSGKTHSGASAWLISREIAQPTAGRLGISMSLRGEPPQLADSQKSGGDSLPKANLIELRVAIEGERNGQPIRHSATVQVPRNGKWQPGRFVLEWLDVDPYQDQNLRITIDNLSYSVVWIDDIVVTDYFASASERSDLQSLAYLAVQGVQHSNLKPAARLLNNYWAQDLLRIAQLPANFDDKGDGKTARSSDDRDAGDRFRAVRRDSPAWGEAPERKGGANSKVGVSDVSLPVSQLPPLPSAQERASVSAPTVTHDTSESAGSFSGKIRRWLPDPLKF